MSSRQDRGGGGGGRGREVFLSAHRCPEVDLLPQNDSEAQIPADKSPEVTCAGKCGADYLDICSERRAEGEEEEDDEGSVSDWSEEDLSLHFSPSVILQSDEESDPESGFECVDVILQTQQVKGQERERLKMVPKRQIQLKKKKKKDAENIEDQVMPKKGPAKRGGDNNDPSANELLGSAVRRRPDLLQRQHSMPNSFHTHSTTSSDVNTWRVYKGLVAGANQGVLVGGNTRRLQKSVSLDETKTKMASCIIKNVLSKKMQVEQTTDKTSHPKTRPEALPGLPSPAEQQGGREGERVGGGVSKAPVHVVRDVRSLVKNTYRLSFATTTTTTVTSNSNRPTSVKVIGQDDSPPPTYQQAVGVRAHVSKVAASFSQSHGRKQSSTFGRPIAHQRRGSEPIMSRRKGGDVTWPVPLLDPPTSPPVSNDPAELSQSERVVASRPPSVFIQPPKRPLAAQEQSSILGVSSQCAPGSSQQVLHPLLYTPAALPGVPSAPHPRLGKVSYIHGPLSYVRTQLQPPTPVPTVHLLRRSEENQSRSTGNFSDQLRNTGDRKGQGSTVTPATQHQHQHQHHHHQQQQQQQQQQLHQQQQLRQQQFLCSLQGFLPAQVGGDFLVDMAGAAVAPGALVSVPAPCHLMLDPKSRRYFYVDTPPQPQRKMLLDPETGQFIQVYLPAAGSASSATMFPVCFATPTPTMITHTPSVLQVGGANPTILSVMQFPPPMAVSSLYSPSCLPLTVMTPHLQHRDDITPSAP